MANQVTLPRLGQGMESGTIVRWLKAEGDKVEKGEPLYELDTEKVTQEVEADASGVVLKILAGEGEEIEVGKPVAVIGEEGEDISSESDDSSEERRLGWGRGRSRGGGRRAEGRGRSGSEARRRAGARARSAYKLGRQAREGGKRPSPSSNRRVRGGG